ncbi:MAG: HlyD family efflux transporter periplasmic adaptor subunit [Leptolyngbya sp. SIO3F4]|nr:HlyD family efflux transporter periplasmic adaptor subunit [Leptolyngbya sp. SIO3F4]
MENKKLTPLGSGRAREWLYQAVLPGCVLVATIGVLTWSAWPVLRKDRTVQVAQVVFDRSMPNAQAAGGAEQPSADTGPVVQAAGWLEAEPYYTACTALVDGIIDRMHVLEGDLVEKGDVVATLVREDEELRLRKAEADVLAAQSRVELAKAEFAAAQAAWDDPVGLDRAIETSEALLAASRAELAQLPSLITAARARLERFEAEQRWIEQSRTGGAATELEFIVAQKAVEAERGEVDAVEARRPLLEARVREYEAEQRAARRALDLRIEDRRRLNAARATIGVEESTLVQLQAVRDEAALALDRTVIRAPITGYVQNRLKGPGDKVMRMMDNPHSNHIVHLYDPEKLQVRVDVPLADAAHIRVGQPCEIVVEVLPDVIFRGEVIIVTHQADLQKNTLEIKVKVHDPDPLLKPEMLSRVRFLSSGAMDRPLLEKDVTGSKSTVLVPAETLDRSSDVHRVWVISDRRRGRGVLQPVEVQSLGTENGWLRVTGEIQPGALLAIAEPGLRDGMRVAITEDDS